MSAASVTVQNGQTLCTACNGALGPSDEPWKGYAVTRRVALEDAGPGFDTHQDRRVLLAHFYCPSCARLLDTETAMEGDPNLADRIA